MRHGSLVVIAAALVTAACAGAVQPSPAGPTAVVSGIEMTAAAGAWRGWPSALPQLVTPIHVTIANRGAVPVRLDVTSFALVMADGTRLAAALPADVQAVTGERPPADVPDVGITVGPTRERSGSDWAINRSDLDPRAEPTLEPERTWALPTPDMLRQALPERVLPPGGTVSGFVYFERRPGSLGPVTLVAPVVEASGGDQLGVIEIPLTR